MAAPALPIEVAIGAPHFPVLNAFMRSRASFHAIMGPLGSGKTIGAVQKILAIQQQQEPNRHGIRPTRFLVVRNTYGDLFETTMKSFEVIFTKEYGTMKYGGLEPPQFRCHYKMPDGTIVKSDVIFLALDRDDAVRKLRGYEVTAIWYNELKELVRSIVNMGRARLRYPSTLAAGVMPTWRGVFGDYNACDEDHWLYRMAEEELPEGWEFHKQPPGMIPRRDEQGDIIKGAYDPNPRAENLRHLAKDYYEELITGQELDWINVNVCNEYGFLVEGQPIHPLYVDSTHCAKEPLVPIKNVPLTLGIDFGRTPACAITQQEPGTGRWLGIDELCSDDMSAATFGQELKLKIDRDYPNFHVRTWGDPSGDHEGQATDDTPIQMIRAAGIPIQPCDSNSESLRRAAIDNPIRRNCSDSKPAFLISKKMRRTRKGLMGGFCYRRLKLNVDPPRYTDKPDKNIYSHPVEALEYALMGGGEGRAAVLPPRPSGQMRRRPRRART